MGSFLRREPELIEPAPNVPDYADGAGRIDIIDGKAHMALYFKAWAIEAGDSEEPASTRVVHRRIVMPIAGLVGLISLGLAELQAHAPEEMLAVPYLLRM